MPLSALGMRLRPKSTSFARGSPVAGRKTSAKMAIAILAGLCVTIEAILQAGDLGLIDVPRCRALVYEYGGIQYGYGYTRVPFSYSGNTEAWGVFIDDTVALLPPGAEWQHLNFDAGLAALLDDGVSRRHARVRKTPGQKRRSLTFATFHCHFSTRTWRRRKGNPRMPSDSKNSWLSIRDS